MGAGFEGRRHSAVRTGVVLRVPSDRACGKFAPSSDDLTDTKRGIEVNGLALGNQEWFLRKRSRMEVEEIVAALENRLQLPGADKFVARPVQPLVVRLAKQPIHVELNIALL